MVVRTKQGQQGRTRGRRAGAQVGSGSTPGTPTGGGGTSPVFQVDFTSVGALPSQIVAAGGSPTLSSSGLLISAGDIVTLAGNAASTLQSLDQLTVASVIVEVDGANVAYAQILSCTSPGFHAFIARDNLTNSIYFMDDFGSEATVSNAATGTNRLGVAYDATNKIISANGGAAASNTYSQFFATAFQLGGRSDGSYEIGARVLSMAIYSSKLSGAELAAKTVVGAAY